MTTDTSEGGLETFIAFVGEAALCRIVPVF